MMMMFSPFFISCRRWQWAPDLLSSSCVFSISCKRWRWVEGSLSLVFFSFNTYRKQQGAPYLSSSFDALFINSKKWQWIGACCHLFFISMHLEKTTMSIGSLSFFYFVHALRRWQQARLFLISCCFHFM